MEEINVWHFLVTRSDNDRTTETRQAWTIIGIVALFLIGNIPRVVLNMYEFLQTKPELVICIIFKAWLSGFQIKANT
jgi:hypothetical protein